MNLHDFSLGSKPSCMVMISTARWSNWGGSELQLPQLLAEPPMGKSEIKPPTSNQPLLLKLPQPRHVLKSTGKSSWSLSGSHPEALHGSGSWSIFLSTTVTSSKHQKRQCQSKGCVHVVYFLRKRWVGPCGAAYASLTVEQGWLQVR